MLVLSERELAEFTGATRADAQARELRYMGIPFRQRRNGKLVVLRSDVTMNHGPTAQERQASPALRLP